MKYQLAEHVSLTEVDDEVVLLDLNTGAYFGLNHVGASLMNQLLLQHSLEDACKEIAKVFQAPHATVSHDVNSLVADLLEQKLIRQS